MSDELNKPAFGPRSFCWHELRSRDTQKARDFFSKLFGWRYERLEGPMDYFMVFTNDDPGPDQMQNIAGSIMDMNHPQWGEAPSHWGYYIDVEDVDATAARVEQLGGKLLHPPFDIPNIGRMAAIEDPCGAHVNLITLTDHRTLPHGQTPGHFLWVELMARGFDKARAFYTELIGWKTDTMPSPDGDYTIFVTGNGFAGGGMEMPEMVPAEVPNAWVGYVHVSNVDETLKLAEAEGGKVVAPAMDIPDVGRLAHLADPTGGVVAIMTPVKK